MSSGPTNNDDTGGFYNPETLPYPIRQDYQEWLNHVNGILSVQVLDGIHNLIQQMPYLYAEQLQLGGERVIWLSQLTYGTRCPNFNYNSDQCSQSKCQFCYNTGWLGGYQSPVELKISFIPGRVDILVEQAGLNVTQMPTAWTINTSPLIKERDVLIMYNNERYTIHGSEAVEKQGRRVYQELTLSRPNKFDVIYSIPVPQFMGDYHQDFPARITIAPFKFDFQVGITVKNYFLFPNDGITS